MAIFSSRCPSFSLNFCLAFLRALLYLVLALVNEIRFSSVLLCEKLFLDVLNSCFAEKHASLNHFGFWFTEFLSLLLVFILKVLPNITFAFSCRKFVKVSTCKTVFVSVIFSLLILCIVLYC